MNTRPPIKEIDIEDLLGQVEDSPVSEYDWDDTLDDDWLETE